MTLKINLGEIWLADLNPRVGSELGKTRPVLIIQDQVLLDAKHPSTLIIPLTTNLIDDAFPLRIRIKAHNKLERDSDLLIDQIRSIDNKRLILGPLTTCSPIIMQTIYKAILEVIGVGPVPCNIL
ncbi:Endoribonuclease MazF [Rickettsia tillamookensis]|uniref:mRNA interferase n=1 Tax=Rickettsia tillamookensis TaxID=2761623 RepID=A0A9E6SR40_9RICK|nr:type II toxin-antitoxin system PemK/MazF family toxin [Rickettsia tillamookensis]QQV75761.1 Endoribonuclease MazF [Rickettsia tillamookensis]